MKYTNADICELIAELEGFNDKLPNKILMLANGMVLLILLNRLLILKFVKVLIRMEQESIIFIKISYQKMKFLLSLKMEKIFVIEKQILVNLIIHKILK